MDFRSIHKWDLAPSEAITLQKKLRENLIIKKIRLNAVKLVAGVDVSVKSDISCAAIVVLSFPDMKIAETVTATAKTPFPYIPGLLSFREGPVILDSVRKLLTLPDVFIFDAHGTAHPRGLGLASHMGLFLDKPCIGSAKSHLYGRYEIPNEAKGSFSYLKDANSRPIGASLRTRRGTKLIFVSPGHLADIPSSIKLILELSPKYRIPEPIRLAHNAAKLS